MDAEQHERAARVAVATYEWACVILMGLTLGFLLSAWFGLIG